MDTIKVLGCDYDLLEVDLVSRDGFVFGEVDHVDQIIKIDAGLKPQRKAETIMHEVLHCLFHALGENEAHDDERLVRALSCGLVQVLRDNPELTSLFLGLSLR